MCFNDGTRDHMQFASTEKNTKEDASLPKEIHKQPRQCGTIHQGPTVQIRRNARIQMDAYEMHT